MGGDRYMTQDDLNNSKSGANVYTTDRATRVDGVVDQFNVVNINAGVIDTLWDLAVASADDALVLVRWLDSKRDA